MPRVFGICAMRCDAIHVSIVRVWPVRLLVE